MKTEWSFQIAPSAMPINSCGGLKIMQTKYPIYIAPVQSNDDYSDEPTNCTFEVQPSIVFRIAWYLVLTRLMQRLAKSCSEVRFYFPNISWMALIEDDNLLSQELIEKGGFADGDQIGFSFNICEAVYVAMKSSYTAKEPSASCVVTSIVELSSSRMKSVFGNYLTHYTLNI